LERGQHLSRCGRWVDNDLQSLLKFAAKSLILRSRHSGSHPRFGSSIPRSPPDHGQSRSYPVVPAKSGLRQLRAVDCHPRTNSLTRFPAHQFLVMKCPVHRLKPALRVDLDGVSMMFCRPAAGCEGQYLRNREVAHGSAALLVNQTPGIRRPPSSALRIVVAIHSAGGGKALRAPPDR
jgi:hypothetical protein